MPSTAKNTDFFEAPPSVLQRPPLDPATTALVVVDMVNWQVPRIPNDSGLAPAYFVNRLAEIVIPNHKRLIAACRKAGMPVIFLRVGCARPDYMDAVPSFREAFKQYHALDGTAACEVIPELAPMEGEITLLKTGSGGYNTSALDIHLRNMNIKQVLYTGVITNGCVMLTATAGFDLGYHGHLVTDATATFSPELQNQAETLIGFGYAPPLTTDEAVGMINAPPAARRL